MYLYACHDISLMPMLTSLKAFDNRWPPYCSDLTFELWQDKAGKHWVNLLYRDEVAVLDFLNVDIRFFLYYKPIIMEV